MATDSFKPCRFFSSQMRTDISECERDRPPLRRNTTAGTRIFRDQQTCNEKTKTARRRQHGTWNRHTYETQRSRQHRSVSRRCGGFACVSVRASACRNASLASSTMLSSSRSFRFSGRQKKCMCGTLAAAAGWQHLVQKVGADIGLLISCSCPCAFGHAT